MGHKKIALFLSHIYGDYQKNLCQGVIDKALEYGYQAEVYTSNDGENLGGLTEMEKCILQIPVYSNLSGIIFASGTYFSPLVRSRVCEALKATGLPVIEVNDTSSSFPNVTMDNNTMIGTVAEHFINMHDAKRLCYLGCANEIDISEIRRKILAETLDKHQLPFGEEDYYNCTETPEDYEAAIDHLSKNGASMPDAILCYNDRLAYELVIAAEKKGLKIPEDFGISGCDNTAAGQNMLPPLTTISYPVYDLGQIAVDNLLNLIKGKSMSNTSVFARVIYGGSCGCSYGADRRPHLYSHTLTARIADLEQSIIMSSQVASAFGEVEDIEDSLDIIADYAGKIRNCTGFYLVLSSGWNNLSGKIRTLTASSGVLPEGEVEDMGSMTLYLALRDGKRLPGCTFRNNELLPDFILSEEENARIVSPIYHHGKANGYVVMTFENDRISYPFQLIQYLVNLSQLLNSLRNKRRSQVMATHLEEIYMRDSITGLYNKAGFDYYKEKLTPVNPDSDYLSVVFLDMNGLKQINDKYGHDAGDFALQVLGQAISSAVEEGSVAARIGGDEFNIITLGDMDAGETIRKKILSYLDNYRRLNSKEYSISASIGVASAKYSPDLVLADLVKEADERMYEAKRQHRQTADPH